MLCDFLFVNGVLITRPMVCERRGMHIQVWASVGKPLNNQTVPSGKLT